MAEDRRSREEAAKRYEMSQLHRTERQAFVRNEEQVRLTILREEGHDAELINQQWEELTFFQVREAAASSVEISETVGRTDIHHKWEEGFRELEWERNKQYAHVCEKGRRKLMDEEEMRRKALLASEEVNIANLIGLQAEEGEGAFRLVFDEEYDSSVSGSPLTISPAETPQAPPTVPRLPYADESSPNQATQTPSYNFASSGVKEDDTLVAHELAILRKELKHERELRERNQEKIAEHERLMKEKSLKLEERERQLLTQLSSDHSKRLDEMRNVLKPGIDKVESFEEADRLLKSMNEREMEWSNREQEWRIHQSDLERETIRLREDLAKMTELHWLSENDKAELKGRCEADQLELISLRSTAERSDARLRKVLIEEQELLCRVEDQWRQKLADADLRLQEMDAKLKRRNDERERYWLQQEKSLRMRSEQVEQEKSQLIEKLEMIQRRLDRGEVDKRKLREELSQESHLSSQKAAADLRSTCDDLDRERRRRTEVEEALAAAIQEQKRVALQLEDSRLSHSQFVKDSQVTAALHESELLRVRKLIPTQPTEYSVLVALETAARYNIIAHWWEGATDLMSMICRHPKPLHIPSRALEEQNTMLRELLSLEEAKVEELERTIRELRRQRGEMGRPSGNLNEEITKLMLQEADGRLQIESSCRDQLIDNLTTQNRVEAPPEIDAFSECSGWLLTSLDSRKPTWRQMFVWVDSSQGLLFYAPADPRGGDVPMSSIDLSNAMTVEIEMFLNSSERPPPVTKYQQLGFYIETSNGLKHRFCSSTVAQRTEWLDTLRRTVLNHSGIWNSWDSKPYTTPSPRNRSRRRSSGRPSLEHLSYIGADQPAPQY
eukprot:TRINITY_DN10068_c0_g1_i1.p1 TRINITY_DN10068_c0_g1~~TRINITY_DN10068_c0_g1_i1.p1  ORF type:complete len:842 (+),score=190.33 TRINITY_DN10068_c0_g1_i1:1028-3553(+)